MAYQTVRLKIPHSVSRSVKAGEFVYIDMGGLSGNDVTTLKVTVDIVGFSTVTPADVAVMTLEQSWNMGGVFETVNSTLSTNISADGTYSIKVSAGSGNLAPIVRLKVNSAATASFYINSVYRTSSTENLVVPVAAGSTTVITNPSGTNADFGAGATSAATLRTVTSSNSPEVTSLASILVDTTAIKGKDFATQTTLASVLVDTTAIKGKDFATQTTLASVLVDTTAIKNKDFATQTTLASVLVDTTAIKNKDFATATKQDTIILGLLSIDASTTAIDGNVVTIRNDIATSKGYLNSINNAVSNPIAVARSVANAAIVRDYSAANISDAAWTQIIASTSFPATLIKIFDSSGEIIRVSTGAAGVEADLIRITPGGDTYEISVPINTRIAIRAETGTGTVSVGKLVFQMFS